MTNGRGHSKGPRSRSPPRAKHWATGGVHGPYGTGSTVHRKDGLDAVTWPRRLTNKIPFKRVKSLAKSTKKFRYAVTSAMYYPATHLPPHVGNYLTEAVI